MTRLMLLKKSKKFQGNYLIQVINLLAKTIDIILKRVSSENLVTTNLTK